MLHFCFRVAGRAAESRADPSLLLFVAGLPGAALPSRLSAGSRLMAVRLFSSVGVYRMRFIFCTQSNRDGNQILKIFFKEEMVWCGSGSAVLLLQELGKKALFCVRALSKNHDAFIVVLCYFRRFPWNPFVSCGLGARCALRLVAVRARRWVSHVLQINHLEGGVGLCVFTGQNLLLCSSHASTFKANLLFLIVQQVAF